jgi:ribosomal protein L34
MLRLEPDREVRRDRQQGYASPVRTPRGRDIMAACGQLKSESVKERASARLAAEKLADVQSGQLARMPH